MVNNMNDLLRKAKQYLGNHENWKSENFLLLILIGVLFMVIRIPIHQSKSLENNETVSEFETKEMIKDDDFYEYERELEVKTKEILSSIENAGCVSVMITFQDDGKQVVEKDKEYSSSSEQISDDAGGEKRNSEVQSSETTRYYTNAQEKEVPFINNRYLPKVEGVLVVAEGGDDDYVNLQILRACQALFGIEAHKIVIVKGNACERRTE